MSTNKGLNQFAKKFQTSAMKWSQVGRFLAGLVLILTEIRKTGNGTKAEKVCRVPGKCAYTRRWWKSLKCDHISWSDLFRWKTKPTWELVESPAWGRCQRTPSSFFLAVSQSKNHESCSEIHGAADRKITRISKHSSHCRNRNWWIRYMLLKSEVEPSKISSGRLAKGHHEWLWVPIQPILTLGTVLR